MKALLIIGNGFDLCLGWHTSLFNFFNSRFFPRDAEVSKSKMWQYIVNEANSLGRNWGGLEKSMEDYATLPAIDHSFEEDKVFYDVLCRKLRLFIVDAVYKYTPETHIPYYSIPEGSSCSSYFVGECILYDNAVDKVVSFNYTGFENIVSAVSQYYVENRLIGQERVDSVINGLDCTYLHCDRLNYVVGIANDAVLQDDRYSFLKKSHRLLPQEIYSDLLESDIIIFWGFSFSKCDQPYFKDFFKYLASPKSEDYKRRTIFNVSLDDDSQTKCIMQIESMLGGDITPLLTKHHFVKVNTNKDNNSEGFSELLLTLRQKSEMQ